MRWLAGALGLGLCLGCGNCGGGTPGTDGGPGVDGGGPGRDAGSGTDSGSSTDAGGGADSGATDSGPLSDGGVTQDFPASSVFYQDISGAAADPNSAIWISNLGDAGGWGNGRFQIDNSITILYADPSVQPRTWTPDPLGYYSPDCDLTPVPVPPGGNVEGSTDYTCPGGGDCHLLVYQGQRLYELYHAQIAGGTATGSPFTTLCEVPWDLTRDYWQPGTPYSRGDQCSSTDASGLPVAPLLVTGAELQAGVIRHAMRFTLPRPRMDVTQYVHPATHGVTGTGLAGGPPFGARFRLRANYPLAGLSAGGRTVAVALQTYGMFLDDIGTVALTVDASATYALLGSLDLQGLQVSDFDVVVAPSAPIPYNGNCTRTQLTQ